MKIAIIGAGNFGTAAGIHLAKKGNDVWLYTIEQDVYEQIKKGENKKYLPGIKIPKNISVELDLNKAVKGAKFVFVAVPSAVVEKVLIELKKTKIKATIVNLSKGLSVKGEFLSEVYSRHFPLKNVVMLSGPSIAREVASGQFTAVEVAGKKAASVKKLVENKRLRVFLTKNDKALEFGGFYKNIIALAVGMCDGAKFGDNVKAAIVISGLHEARNLAKKMKIDQDELYGLVGLGDLFVTCVSKHSRNRSCGELLGKGHSIKGAQQKICQTIEGVVACQVALKLSKKYKIKLPLAEIIMKVVEGKKKASSAIDEYFLEITKQS